MGIGYHWTVNLNICLLGDDCFVRILIGVFRYMHTFFMNQQIIIECIYIHEHSCWRIEP